MSGGSSGPPIWAMEPARPGDRVRADRARRRGSLRAGWDSVPGSSLNYGGRPVTKGPPKDWAKRNGWPTPWLSFEPVFIRKLLESDACFDLALEESGVELFIPIEQHDVSAEQLAKLDALYEKTEDDRHVGWGALVAALRELRQATDAGVHLTIGGTTLRGTTAFYEWAHGRYHALEDGYDDGWILSDERG